MRKNNGTFFCFSPPVMMATFLIEVGLIFYTFARFKMNATTRLAAGLLFFLAMFQLAEYNVCGGLGLHSGTWARVGFVAITMLPPICIHFIQSIAGKPISTITKLAYGNALIWTGLFMMPDAFNNYACGGNYVIFKLAGGIGGWYFAYYYAWLFVGIALALYYSQNANVRVRRALLLQVVGYLSFLFPTMVINTLNPTTVSGLPSIMCGFAVFFALIIALGILPSLQPKQKPLFLKKSG